MKPVLVIVNGRFGTGKTFMAKRLATDLQLPLINRDSFKESIYDELQSPSPEILEQMGPISWGAIWSACEQLLSAGVSHVLESNFSPKSAVRLQDLMNDYAVRGVQVHLWTTLEVSLQRSLERIQTGARHPVHLKERELAALSLDQRMELLKDSNFMRAEDQPMDLEVPLIRVDTSDFAKLDYGFILNSVRRFIAI